MSKHVASYYIHANGESLDTFVANSNTLSWASLSQTMAAVGSLNTLSASRYVVSTLMTESRDAAEIYDALYNPAAHEALWLMAFAAQGDLYDSIGNRISSMNWDIEYSAESGAFYHSEDVVI